MTKPIDALVEALVAALEAAQNGLRWYQDMYPSAGSGADDEMHEQIDAALARASAALAQPDGGEPLFWYRPCSDGEMYQGPIHNVSIERVRKESGGWKPLYTHPPQPAQAVPEGWKLVPVEPTEGMLRAGWSIYRGTDKSEFHPNMVWVDMLAAAPQPPKREG